MSNISRTLKRSETRNTDRNSMSTKIVKDIKRKTRKRENLLHTKFSSYVDAKKYSIKYPELKIFGVYLRTKLRYDDILNEKILTLTENGRAKVGKGFLENGKLKRDASAGGSDEILEILDFIPCLDEDASYQLEDIFHNYLTNVLFRWTGRVMNSDGDESGKEWFKGFPTNKTDAINSFQEMGNLLLKDTKVGFINFISEYFQEEGSDKIVDFYKDINNTTKLYKEEKEKILFYLLMKPRSGKNPTTLLGLAKIQKWRISQGINDAFVVDYLTYWPSAMNGAMEDIDKFNFIDDIRIGYVNTYDSNWKSEYKRKFKEYDVLIRFSSMQSLSRMVSDTYNTDEEDVKEGDDINFDKSKLDYLKKYPADLCIRDEGDFGFGTELSTKIYNELSHYKVQISLSGSDFYALKNLINEKNYYSYDIIQEDKDNSEGKINRKIPRIIKHTVRPHNLINSIPIDDMSSYGLSRRNEVLFQVNNSELENPNSSKDYKFGSNDIIKDKKTGYWISRYTGVRVYFKNKSEALEYLNKNYFWKWSNVEYDASKPIDSQNIFWTMPSKLSIFAVENHFLDDDFKNWLHSEFITLNSPKYSNPNTMEKEVNHTINKANREGKRTVVWTRGKMLRGGKASWDTVVRCDDFTSISTGIQIELRSQNSDGKYCNVFDANIWRVSTIKDEIIKMSSNGKNQSEIHTLVEECKLIPIYVQGSENENDQQYSVETLSAFEVDVYKNQNDIIKSFSSDHFFNDTIETREILKNLIGEKNNTEKRDKRAGKNRKLAKTVKQTLPKDKEKKFDTSSFKTLSKYLPILIWKLQKNDIKSLIYDCPTDYFRTWITYTGNDVDIMTTKKWKDNIYKLFDREKINNKIRVSLGYYEKEGISQNDIYSMSRPKVGDVPVNPELVKEILDKFPKDYWKTYPTLFEPSCGIGAEFAYQWKLRIESEGCKNPEKYIFINDTSIININFSLKRLGNKFTEKNIHNMKKQKMKFDAIVGNPPYQDGERTDQANKAWPQFIKDGSEMLKKDGILSLITPNGWMNSKTSDIGKGKTGTKIYQDIFKNGNLIFVNYDSDGIQSKWFTGVGSTFSIFIFQNSVYSGETEFFHYTHGSEYFDISNIENLPKLISKTTFSIIDKINLHTDKFDFIDQNHNLNGKEVFGKTSTHIYKAFHTHRNGGTFIYGDKQSWFAGKHNVAITLSGKYEAIYTTNSFSNMCLGLSFDNVEFAKNAINILNSKLYKFIILNSKFAGFNPRSTILSLPKLDLTRSWTDEEIFKEFDLSDEEKQYVHDNVK